GIRGDGGEAGDGGKGESEERAAHDGRTPHGNPPAVGVASGAWSVLEAGPACQRGGGPPHAKPGGGTKAWNSRSSSRASSTVVRSLYWGPTICTPTGRPPGVKPAGADVPGRNATPERPAQKSWSTVGTRRPLTVIVRW